MSLPCPGSNGIREWIASQARSQPPLTWSQFLTLAFMAIVFVTVLGMSACHALPLCMTHAEAREVWPREYLHWHGDHCWSGHSIRSAHAEVRRVPLPKSKPFILLLEQSEPQEWIYADRWWLSADEISYRSHWCNRKLSGSWCR